MELENIVSSEATKRFLEVADKVIQLGQPLRLSTSREHEIRTAVVEALSNAFRHGSDSPGAPLRLHASQPDDQLNVVVYNHDRRFDRVPEEPKNLNDSDKRIGGWGFHFMRTFASEIVISNGSRGHTFVSLKFERDTPSTLADVSIQDEKKPRNQGKYE